MLGGWFWFGFSCFVSALYCVVWVSYLEFGGYGVGFGWGWAVGVVFDLAVLVCIDCGSVWVRVNIRFS